MGMSVNHLRTLAEKFFDSYDKVLLAVERKEESIHAAR